MVYLNFSVIKNIFYAIVISFFLSEPIKEQYIDFDRPTAWMYTDNHMCRFGGLDNWFAAKNNKQILRAFRDIAATASKIASRETIRMGIDEEKHAIAEAIAYCEKFILRYVRENNSVMFYLIFPPYSRIRFSTWHQHLHSEAHIHEAIVRYFVNAAQQLDNLLIFGFEDQAFLDLIELYKDTTHYHPKINQYINYSLAKKEALLTQDNVEQYILRARDAALSFDLVGLGNKIATFLELDTNTPSGGKKAGE